MNLQDARLKRGAEFHRLFHKYVDNRSRLRASVPPAILLPVFLRRPLLLLLAFTPIAFAQTVTWRDALKQPATWFASAEAVRIADNLLLYQHDIGGWDKNIDMAQPLGPKE